jgi:FdhE protein
VICPYCEDEAQEGMDFFYVEKRTQESAFSCDKCRRYLVTLNKVSDLSDHDLDVSALSLTHLDVIMQGKGLDPMVSCAWNTFEG